MGSPSASARSTGHLSRSRRGYRRTRQRVTVSWLVLSAVFSWYIAHFGSYDATYGSLGAAIGMMTWMWISMIVVLLGAELNAEIQRKANAPSSAS